MKKPTDCLTEDMARKGVTRELTSDWEEWTKNNSLHRLQIKLGKGQGDDDDSIVILFHILKLIRKRIFTLELVS